MSKGKIETPSQIINYYLKQIKEVDGTMYRLESEDRTFETFEAFDDDKRGCRMNLLGIRLEWIFEGKNIIKKFPRSKRRRIKKKVETALRKARKKYAE